MKSSPVKNLITLALSLFIGNQYLFSQGSWISITPSNTFYSFSLPNSSYNVHEASDVLRYTFRNSEGIILVSVLDKHESSFYTISQPITLPFDSIPTDSLPDSLYNPCVLLYHYVTNLFDETSILYINDFAVQGTNITGREFGFSYKNRKEEIIYLFIRTYYNGHDLLTFSASAPTTEYEELVDYKNTYFDSIEFLE